jgi:hypothetical protein
MLEDFTHGTLEINRGRWFINNIITLSSESSNATSGAHCKNLCYTACVYLRCRYFLPKCFSIEKLRLQEAQSSTDYFLIETYCHCCYYTCTSKFFFLIWRNYVVFAI